MDLHWNSPLSSGARFHNLHFTQAQGLQATCCTRSSWSSALREVEKMFVLHQNGFRLFAPTFSSPYTSSIYI